MSKKMKIQMIIGVILTVVIVYFSVVVLKSLNMKVVLEMKINWLFVILSIAVYVCSNYIRGLAYSRGIDKEMDDMTAFQVIGIGHALNMVLPLHAGEGLRLLFFPSSYTVVRRTKLAVITILADAIVVIIISALTVPFAGITNQTMLKVMWYLLFGCIGLLAAFAAVLFFVPRIRNYLSEYLNKSLLEMFAWCALSWVVMVAAFWFGLAAFGFGLLEAVRMACAVFVTTTVINLIPASPGAIGLFEYGTIIALVGFGVDKNQALSASLLLHLIQYMTLIPLGIFLYIKAMHGKYGEAIRTAWKKGQEIK
jgi:uncharacterized membrane protein YbhN (UPF0104 family)